MTKAFSKCTTVAVLKTRLFQDQHVRIGDIIKILFLGSKSDYILFLSIE